jgi:manganese transport system ATP-binding protein
MGLAVEGHGVTVGYGGHVALRDCDVTMARGSVTALVGPNGSGKSTLLSAIAGLVPLTSGTLTVLGRRPGNNGLAARVAYVLQSTPAKESLPITVREVVTMARFARRGLFGRMTAADRQIVAEALEQLEVADLADRHLRELSGGQRQRVLVAQGLAQGADLLLLDEPVTGLDLTSRDRILAVVDNVRSSGGAVVVATHDLADAERADHVILLAGRVIAGGSPSEVITSEHLRRAYGGRPIDDAAVAAHVDEHLHYDGAAAWPT